MSDELKTLKVGGFARNILEYVSGDGIEISTDPNDGNKRIVSADGLAVIRIVSNLPATGDADTLYVVPKASGQPGNSRDEFIWVNSQWEKVGDTFVPSNYYTKIETDELISDIGGLEFVLVDTLPEEGQQGKIYLLKKTGTTDRDEYIWVNDAWELIGDTAVDMSNYYTKTETDNRLDTKVDKVTGKGLSTNDYTTAEKTKLQGIEAGAEVNVQADWNQTDATKDDFIKNKPDLDDFITCDTLSDCRGYFTGVTDTTVNVGDTFDPRSGVSAFDKDDAPIDYVVLPNTVDTSAEGTYQLVYLAGGTDPVIRTVTVEVPSVTEAYAYIDTATNEMHFFRDDENKYTDGQVIGTKTYYTGIETTAYTMETLPTWLNQASVPTSAVFDDDIAPISTCAMFGMMPNLASISNIDKLDTSNVTTMDAMFFGCASLTSLDLSNFDVSNVTSMWSMLQDCVGLTSLDLSAWNNSSVEYLNSMFQGCTNLASIDISNLDTSNAVETWSMFQDCSSLTSIDLSSWNTSSLESTMSMFKGCSSLTSVDLDSWNTPTLFTTDSMFSGCSSLTSIDFPNIDMSNVTQMRGMFSGCESLTSLDLSSWDTSSAEIMGSMFDGCESLTSLDISSFDTSNVTTMYAMFQNCKALQTLDLSSFDTARNTITSSMFNGCTALQTICVSPAFVVTRVSASTSTNMFLNCTNLVGGSGTTYSSSAINYLRAKIDGGTADPGYFSNCSGGQVLCEMWYEQCDRSSVCPQSPDQYNATVVFLSLNNGDRVKLYDGWDDTHLTEYDIVVGQTGGEASITIGEYQGRKTVSIDPCGIYIYEGNEDRPGCNTWDIYADGFLRLESV